MSPLEGTVAHAPHSCCPCQNNGVPFVGEHISVILQTRLDVFFGDVGGAPLKSGWSEVRVVRYASLMEATSKRCRGAARTRASSTEWSEENGPGIAMPATFSAPIASAATQATSVSRCAAQSQAATLLNPHLGCSRECQNERVITRHRSRSGGSRGFARSCARRRRSSPRRSSRAAITRPLASITKLNRRRQAVVAPTMLTYTSGRPCRRRCWRRLAGAGRVVHV